MRFIRTMVAGMLPSMCLAVNDPNAPRGANIDESAATTVIYVNQVTGNDANAGTDQSSPRKTINSALSEFGGKVACKIIVAPGKYREELVGGDGDALLILEGAEKGKVFVTGSDSAGWEPSTWTSEGGNLYSHAWPYDFGTPGGAWQEYWPTGNNMISWRHELLFLDGQWIPQKAIGDGNGLPQGFFCVNEGANRIWVKPPSDIDFKTALVEVGVRDHLFTTTKDNLVIRNIIFEHATNGIESGAVTLGGKNYLMYELENHAVNTMLEDCEIRYNNGDGLMQNGIKNQTLRRVKINHNGVNGVRAAYVQYCLWEDVEINNSGWRADSGGTYEWAQGGVKLCWCGKYCDFIRVQACYNGWQGFWCDGNHYGHTFIDCRMTHNHDNGLFFEINEGPHFVEHCYLTANGNGGMSQCQSMNIHMRNCWIVNNNQSQLTFGGIRGGGRCNMGTVPEYQGPNFGNDCRWVEGLHLFGNIIGMTTVSNASWPPSKLFGIDYDDPFSPQYAPRFLNVFTGDSNMYY